MKQIRLRFICGDRDFYSIWFDSTLSMYCTRYSHHSPFAYFDSYDDAQNFLFFCRSYYCDYDVSGIRLKFYRCNKEISYE